MKFFIKLVFLALIIAIIVYNIFTNYHIKKENFTESQILKMTKYNEPNTESKKCQKITTHDKCNKEKFKEKYYKNTKLTPYTSQYNVIQNKHCKWDYVNKECQLVKQVYPLPI